MISENIIMNKLKQYANSPAGKKKIKEVCGIDYEPRKQNIRKEILKKAEEMRKILYKHIKFCHCKILFCFTNVFI